MAGATHSEIGTTQWREVYGKTIGVQPSNPITYIERTELHNLGGWILMCAFSSRIISGIYGL